MLTQLAKAVAAVFKLFTFLVGLVSGSNGNKANLSPAGAGVELSLAIPNKA